MDRGMRHGPVAVDKPVVEKAERRAPPVMSRVPLQFISTQGRHSATKRNERIRVWKEINCIHCAQHRNGKNKEDDNATDALVANTPHDDRQLQLPLTDGPRGRPRKEGSHGVNCMARGIISPRTTKLEGVLEKSNGWRSSVFHACFICRVN